jgi:hypothetical protein
MQIHHTLAYFGGSFFASGDQDNESQNKTKAPQRDGVHYITRIVHLEFWMIFEVMQDYLTADEEVFNRRLRRFAQKKRMGVESCEVPPFRREHGGRLYP